MTPLESKFEDRSAVVAVMGLGYVGLPLLHAFWDAGFGVLGFDTDAAKLQMLLDGQTYLKHLGDGMVRQMRGTDRFDATGDFSRLADADAILVCVPTPLDRHKQPDLSFVEQTVTDVARTLRPGQLVVLESSTYPGTTREVLLPRLETRGLECGRDFFSRLFARARGSRQSAPHDRCHPQGCRRRRGNGSGARPRAL